MKFFIYKALTVSLLIFVLFHLTFGYVVKSYETKIYNNFTKDKIFQLKNKVKSEIQNSTNNEKILSKEDAVLLKKFITKIRNELNAVE
jgi:hypothetical protein|tara:strand:- start:306 stop:569 length:264 start_codon:yes stop_codon:yes gene_type:complete